MIAYSTVIASATHQHELAIGRHANPSLLNPPTSLLAPPAPQAVTEHRVCGPAYRQTPTGDLLYIW